ncbi:uncharacterized protein LOC129286741 [Prosopis cineraria]|uniref:uncharacterized protein LOC129286741 n=1 Tax=Prosopis cineraria TaxID=364024 RepID=UPI00240EA233|nr:uncharacterized protein LOC129286741 [Prosopis cineraria]
MALRIQEPTDLQIPDEQANEDLSDPASIFSMLHLNNTCPSPSSAVASGGCGHLIHHPPCISCGCQGFNPMKRRSPESEWESSRAKKPSCEQEDQTQPPGYSAVPLPLSLESPSAIHNTRTRSISPVFRRCFSDPYTAPSAAGVGAPVTPNPSPENSTLASRLPPRPPNLKRCVSDPSPSAKTACQESSLEDTGMGMDLSKEEDSNLMRMRRMKDRLREMKKWWDEVIQEEEEQVDEGNKAVSVSQVDEGNKAVPVSQDDSVMEDGAEETVSVEWVEKSLCINFKCPCGKGYQILLSGNKCFYKLV